MGLGEQRTPLLAQALRQAQDVAVGTPDQVPHQEDQQHQGGGHSQHPKEKPQQQRFLASLSFF